MQVRSVGLTALLALSLYAVAPAQSSLTTLFASNNGGSVGGANYFDIDVTNPAGIHIVKFDQNFGAAVSTPVTLTIYLTPTTAFGKEANLSAWTLMGTGSGTAAGLDLPTAVDTRDLYLPAGKYGIAIVAGGSALRYTNGTGSNQSYSNADLALQLGTALNVPFTGTPFTPRVWNGTIYYYPGGSTTPVFGVYGGGCKGTNGKPPQLDAASGSVPKIGTTFNLSLTDMPGTVGAGSLFIGTSTTTWSGGALPFDLGVIGMPGCALLTNPLLNVSFVNMSGTGSVSLPIPNNLAFVGQAVFMQGFVVDTGANALGLTVTNGGAACIGQ